MDHFTTQFLSTDLLLIIQNNEDKNKDLNSVQDRKRQEIPYSIWELYTLLNIFYVKI